MGRVERRFVPLARALVRTVDTPPCYASTKYLIMAGEAKSIAQQFVTHYYALYDGDRSQMAPLFTEASSMIFEGAEFTGQVPIVGKLTNLNFRSCKHDLTTARLDVSVTAGGGILIVVTGVMSVDEGPPMAFVDTFVLQNNGGSWYIHNLIFRLNLT